MMRADAGVIASRTAGRKRAAAHAAVTSGFGSGAAGVAGEIDGDEDPGAREATKGQGHPV